MLERAKKRGEEDRIKRRQYQFNKAIVLHGVDTKLVAKDKNYITDFGCLLIIQRTCTCKKKMDKRPFYWLHLYRQYREDRGKCFPMLNHITSALAI